MHVPCIPIAGKDGCQHAQSRLPFFEMLELPPKKGFLFGSPYYVFWDPYWGSPMYGDFHGFNHMQIIEAEQAWGVLPVDSDGPLSCYSGPRRIRNNIVV